MNYVVGFLIFFFKWADYTLSTFFLLANAIFIEHLQHTSLSKSSFSPIFFLRTISFTTKENADKVRWAHLKKKWKLHNSYKILNQQWLKNTFFQYSKCHSSVNIWLIFSDHFLAVNYEYKKYTEIKLPVLYILIPHYIIKNKTFKKIVIHLLSHVNSFKILSN